LPTYRQYFEHAASLAGEPFARVYPIASLAATTLTVTRLARGELAEKYAGQYLLRQYASAAADRERTITSFDSSTGVFTHGGASYSDTTATDEKVLVTPIPPSVLDDAIVRALEQCTRLDWEMIPGFQGNRYPLTDFTWITRRALIKDVRFRYSPVFTRNRHMDKWNTLTSGGVLQPDWWTLTGSGATMVRDSTNGARPSSPYTVAITRSGTDCYISQSVSTMLTGVTGARSYADRTIYAVAKVKASVASRTRVRLLVDGSVVASSSYHTGGGTVEELSTSYDVSETANSLEIRITVETGDTTVYVDEAYLVPDTLSDGVRKDVYEEELAEASFEQGPPLVMRLPFSIGKQVMVRSERPYPAFDATRVASGSADADSSDAPLTLVACGILAYAFEKMAVRQPEMYGEPAKRWRAEFDTLRGENLQTLDDSPMTMMKQTGRGKFYQPVIRR
jgi:hypothetical protein